MKKPIVDINAKWNTGTELDIFNVISNAIWLASTCRTAPDGHHRNLLWNFRHFWLIRQYSSQSKQTPHARIKETLKCMWLESRTMKLIKRIIYENQQDHSSSKWNFRTDQSYKLQESSSSHSGHVLRCLDLLFGISKQWLITCVLYQPIMVSIP